jgi:hypothetical protein
LKCQNSYGININYFDGQTPLSEEELDGLKILSITTREELDEFEQLNIGLALSQAQNIVTSLTPKTFTDERERIAYN